MTHKHGHPFSHCEEPTASISCWDRSRFSQFSPAKKTFRILGFRNKSGLDDLESGYFSVGPVGESPVILLVGWVPPGLINRFRYPQDVLTERFLVHL